MGRGRGRGNYNAGRKSDRPGPLMTDHIRNLDLELELLKRKREMIEQQQQLLSRQINYDQQTTYDERQYNPLGFGSGSNSRSNSASRNYSFMYDDRSNSAYVPLNGGSRKRPSESIWRDNSQPKRFSGPSPKRGNAKKPQGSRPAPAAPASSVPSRYFESPKSAARPKPKPLEQKPKVIQTQSFKAKPSAPQNKLASYPTAERKSLVIRAVKAVNETMILREDAVPSVQLTGRLELALGHLLKEIKGKYGSDFPYSLCFKNHTSIKPMKALIRLRVREVMMGKEVGSLPDIVKIYRQKYPPESDLDIVNKGLAHQALSDVRHATNTLATDVPETLIKESVSLMVELKLHQMFLKLNEIYGPESPKGKTIIKVEDVKTEDSDATKNATTNQTVGENETTKIKEENSTENEDNPNNTDKVSTEATEIVDDNKKKDDSTEIKDETEKKDDAVCKEISMETEKKLIDKLPTKEKIVLDYLIENKLSEMLQKNIKFIVSLLNLEELSNAIKKFEKRRAENKSSVFKKASYVPLKYYAKIYCRKGLPKKNVMQEFLKQFQPKSVKKHKANNNLLFVGFDDKESFDKILAANETVLGKYTLQISLSESKKDKPIDADDTADKDVVVVDDSLDTSQEDKVISSELDEQINDLLISIKNAEEAENTIEDNDCENVRDGEVNNFEDDAMKIADKIDNDSKMDVTEEKTENVVNANLDEKENDEEKVEENEEQVSGETKTEDVTSKALEVIEEETPKVTENADKPENTSTPPRASSRLTASTPSTIRTRRASRLAQNN